MHTTATAPGTETGTDIALEVRRITNWAETADGQPVEVRAPGRPPVRARIDDRSHDGSLLWITAESTGVRRLLARGDAVGLYRLP